jgi:hypothetical protein
MTLLCYGAISRAGVVYCVKTNGNDVLSGRSWGDAKRTVTGALAAAVSGDQVWVARGKYDESVVIQDGVSLYGGFCGNETDLAQRNWTTNASILNGSGTNGPLVSMNNVGPTTRLDGMVITGGSAAEGGGLRLVGSAAVVANNNFRFNSAGTGGGLSISGSPLFIEFQPVITNNLIFGNHCSGDGGGIAISGCSPRIAWNQIFRNTATRNGGGIAICLGSPGPTSFCSPLIANNFIEANASGLNTIGFGGGIHATAGNAYYICTPIVINNLIAANGGGGVLLIACNGSATVRNNTVVANSGTAIGWGGDFPGICPTVCNNLVAFNSVGLEKGADASHAITNNNVFGNVEAGFSTDYSGGFSAPFTGQNGNISVDPRLANYQFGDFHLQPDSPCRNAGVNDSLVLSWPDLDGQMRTDGSLDIGAYESSGTTWNCAVPILHVSTNGNDLADGLSWATAKRSVQGALEVLTPGLSIGRCGLPGVEVWVARGRYPESIRPVSAFVYLYGGFAGTESSRAERPGNGQARDSILDGGGTNTVVFCENGGYLVSRLDGFTVRNGTAAQGGGIRCRSSSPVIANNLICSNSASESGGGIDCYMANPDIVGNVISQNVSTNDGGGIYGTFAYPTIEQNLIADNRASEGSAIQLYGAGVSRIARNTVRSNMCSELGWGALGNGTVALVACDYFVAEQNLFQRNNALANGGGLFISGALGGLVQNNVFLTNSATSTVPGGGGIFCMASDSARSPLIILNNTFVGNRATGYGPAEYGGAIRFSGLASSNAVVVANNVIVSNSSGIFRYGGDATLLNNCVFGNTRYDYGAGSGSLPPGAGDIQVDPQFVNAAASDFHLRLGSPCIDAGSPLYAPFYASATDFDGVARPLDGNNNGVAAWDIGAFEFIHPLADTDHDGATDQAEVIAGTNPTDAASLLKLWGRCVTPGSGTALCWLSVTGRTYSIQYKPGLSGTWQALTSNIAGCGATLEVQDCPKTNRTRFYRLEVHKE